MFGRLYQFGYVTADLDAAVAALRKRFGEFEVLIENREQQPGSAIRRAAKGYFGAMMLEIIEPRAGIASVYSDSVPDRPDGLVLHHLGYAIDSEAEFADLRTWLREIGAEVVIEGDLPQLAYLYADLKAGLGHLHEYVWLKTAGRDFYAAVPRNAPRRAATAAG